MIVNYQINSLWFNWAQTEQLWKDLLYRTQRKTGNRPTKKVAKERIQGKIRGSSTKNIHVFSYRSVALFAFHT